MLVVLPVVVTPPGVLVIVQLPLGKPLNTTLPDGVVHVGWVIVPTIGAVGLALTVKLLLEVQPVAVSVKVKVTVPGMIPDTTPAFVTDAIALLLLSHVPPVVGVTVAELPAHTSFAPPNTGFPGIGLTNTPALAGEIQLFELVTVKV